jgi:ketosteroid isomerase-like protein
MNDTLAVGRKLVELCLAGNTMEAIETLYSPDIVSIEAVESPAFPKRMEGIETIKGKNEQFYGGNEVHRAEARGPWPHGDRFIVEFTYEVTPKGGPMTGKRMTLNEAALYTVKNGKISQEEFFYDMDG